MKCYVHHDTDSVGICAACGRGLCMNCAADASRRLTCRGTCEERGHRLLKIEDASFEFVEKSKRVLNTNRKVYAGLALFLFLIGAGAVYDGYSREEFLFSLFGYTCVAAGVASVWVAFWMPTGGEESKGGQQQNS